MREINMKKSVLINGKMISNRNDLYQYLQKKFNYPESTGHNLDALWDVLSYSKSLKKITLIHTQELRLKLGDYAQSLIDLFMELNHKNQIQLIIFEGKRDGINQS